MVALAVDPIMVKSVLLTYDENEMLEAYAAQRGESVSDTLRSIILIHLAIHS